MRATVPDLHPTVLLCAAVIGAAGGLLAIVATSLVYLSEDLFARLPLHWMWRPAIGGLIIGAGGLIEPRAPPVVPGPWALLGLAAVLGGVMRSPLTGVVFSLELTHLWGGLLPIIAAARVAYLGSALLLKRSVLTEKVARKGFHLTREYSVDPLEVLFVREVMTRDVISLDAERALRDVVAEFTSTDHVLDRDQHRQRLYPVLSEDRLVGVVSRRDLLDLSHQPPDDRTLREVRTRA